MRQDYCSGRIGAVIGCNEGSTDLRLDTEHGEEVPRAPRIANSLRQGSTIAGETDTVSTKNGHLLDAGCLLLPRRIHAAGDIVVRAFAAGALFVELNQSARVLKRERLQQH